MTDVTNASRTLLYNIVKGEWDAEMLRIFDVPESLLPEVVWSSERVGEVTTTLGLGGMAIAGIAGRSTGGAVWTIVLERGRGEEHVRNGVFPAAECRDGVCAIEASADYDAGGERAEAAGIRA